MQNSHITLLYELSDPRVHIIYICPFTPSAYALQYYEKFLLNLGIISKNRLHFIVPELVNRLPTHLSLSQILWASTRSLNKIKKLILRISSNVVLIPSTIGVFESRIAYLLNVPLLAGNPTTIERISSKSHSKKIFIENHINIAIGAHDISNSEDFLIALSRLITTNMDYKRWIISLNKDYHDESLCYFDVEKLEIYHILKKERDILFQTNRSNDSAAWYSRAVQLGARKRLLIALRLEIKSKIMICSSNIYLNWDNYCKYMKLYGCCIEAYPLEYRNTIDGLLFIDPIGDVHVVGGIDLVLDTNYQTQFIIYPQTIISNNVLESVLISLGKYLFTENQVIGHITIRFQVFYDAIDKINKLNGQKIKYGMCPIFGHLGTIGVASSLNTNLLKSLTPAITGEKHTIYMPIAMCPGLKESREEFFDQIRCIRGITFDSESCSGVLFYLVNSFNSGVLSVGCASDSRTKVLELTIKTCKFIRQQFSRESIIGTRRWHDLQLIHLKLIKLLKKENK